MEDSNTPTLHHTEVQKYVEIRLQRALQTENIHAAGSGNIYIEAHVFWF